MVDEADRIAQARRSRPGAAARQRRRRARPHRAGIPRAARLRTRRHRRHEISRLLPDRRRLHPVGESERHSGRPGPRLRRRLAGLLRADHHRSRSDPLRAAVRALPQSRARVDAGLRHRLLPGPPRRGDPLRAGALRPRPGGADHHLRHVAGARRAARRRPRAANAIRAGRQALQAGAAESGGSGDAGAGHRGRAEAAGRARRRSGGQARLRHRAQARRPDAPRLDPRRRHRDRRPRAVRTGAALPRSEIRHAGDPVQHEMGGAGGAGEVRLPRPQDAHRTADRGGAGEAARHRDRSHRDPARRQENLRPAGARRSGRRVPTGKRRHAARAARHAARPFRGHHRAGRALSAGSDGEHPDLLRAQARHGAAGLHPSQARADPEGDLRRHRLSGTGDAGGADPRRLHARPGRSAAPRHGQENPQGNAARSAPISSKVRSSAASSAIRPTPSSICSSASPNTASTRATPRPMRWSPTRPPT